MLEATRWSISRPAAAVLLMTVTWAGLWAVRATPSAQASWGVRVESLRAVAGGLLLDLRYRVLDTAKAGALTARGVRPVLIHESTGARFGVPDSPKVGPLRSRNAPAGRTQFVLFRNPRLTVVPGDRVTVELGPLRLAGLVVE